MDTGSGLSARPPIYTSYEAYTKKITWVNEHLLVNFDMEKEMI
jgi:hypothetical protein